MGRKEMQSLFSLITAAVFFTAAFFTGRQAAVLTGKFRVEREQSRQSRTKYCVVVDAGHGGDDPGKIGTAGTLEKEINLAIAKRLEALLKQADVAVVMTRTDSNGLYDENASGKKVQDMKRRVSMMEEAKADLAVSIHQNSYQQDASVHGPQVFYYESSVKGKKLAEAVQSSLNEKLEIDRPREIKGNTSYYLLKRSPGTLVIVECGFLTNPEEARKLQTEVYQQRVAAAVADGIDTYLHVDNRKSYS